ncbi:MAG: hypothetical protein N2202_08900, partial [Proteobacteria bacterium]|nr:hypothetical protein [Pseudomonadota bacterium]
ALDGKQQEEHYDKCIAIFEKIANINKEKVELLEEILRNSPDSIFTIQVKDITEFEANEIDMLNTLHNFVNQLLTSMKAKDIVEETKKRIAEGQRVVINMFNTYEYGYESGNEFQENYSDLFTSELDNSGGE